MSEILVRATGGRWVEPIEHGFGREAELQQILADHPQLIPGVEAGAVACTEFQSGAGPADVVVVSPDGSLTLVECKLASNPQIRREIVGQLFDYASGFFNMPIDEFESRWKSRMGTSLEASISPIWTGLRDAVEKNLQSGRFSVVLAVDAINPGLKRMVEYLNAMSGPSTSVIAVEYVRHHGSGVEILIPRTYGLELAEAKVSAAERSTVTWTLEQQRSWIKVNDRENLGRFDLLVRSAADVDIPFVGSPIGVKSEVPASGLRIIRGELGELGTVYLYHYRGRSSSVEFSFTKAPPILAQDEEASSRFEALLDELALIPEVSGVADLLRTSNCARRPNVPLGDLSEAGIGSVVKALQRLVS
ncbi:hypothetical protein [Arthrobacter sp. 260]|uniref:hypothetical protein n=1 Tax=Arthrobacter sp. 260 TaxID=2735314 RepID=UPI0014915E57|nr:hypothetical protein [Arthrobacter sp. 260]NOJ59993.1 hypothetical protein [Arthrobacter sp. 260]